MVLCYHSQYPQNIDGKIPRAYPNSVKVVKVEEAATMMIVAVAVVVVAARVVCSHQIVAHIFPSLMQGPFEMKQELAMKHDEQEVLSWMEESCLIDGASIVTPLQMDLNGLVLVYLCLQNVVTRVLSLVSAPDFAGRFLFSRNLLHLAYGSARLWAKAGESLV